MTHRVTEGHASVIFLQSNREQFKLFRTPGTQTELDVFFTSVILPTVCLVCWCHGARHVPCCVGHVWPRTMRGTGAGDKAVTRRGEGGIRARSTMLVSATFRNIILKMFSKNSESCVVGGVSKGLIADVHSLVVTIFVNVIKRV